MAISELFSFLLFSLLAPLVGADCESYGVDYQPGGNYFINATSTSDFAFVQYFEGCQPDNSSNILVDPNGNQYLCSDTPLTPDDKNEQSTCPIEKDQMSSGPWSILILSNNGNSTPIAFERDFSLVVGVPVTSTVTPTVTVTVTTSPTKIVTATATKTTHTTSFVTTALSTITPTTTITPAPVTTTITSVTATDSKTAVSVVPVVITSTHTKTCSLPPKQTSPDPIATITATIPGLSISINLRHRARATDDYFKRDSYEARIAERNARFEAAGGLEKRDLDKATTTVTDTNTKHYPTTTSTVYSGRTLTATSKTTITSTSTITRTTAAGTTTIAQVTATAPPPVSTTTKNVMTTITVTTITQHPTVTITTSVAPPLSTAVCKLEGGKLV